MVPEHVYQSNSSDLPELIFGIAGPIGVDIESICDSLSNALRAVRYKSEVIHLTQEMTKYEPSAKPPEDAENNFYTDIIYKSSTPTRFVRNIQDASALAQVALRAIATRRAMLPGGKLQVPVPSTADLLPELPSFIRRVCSGFAPDGGVLRTRLV